MIRRLIPVMAVMSLGLMGAKAQTFSARHFGEGSVVEQIGLVQVIQDPKHSGAIDFAPAQRVRLVPGTEYMWAAFLNTAADQVYVEQSLTLPNRPPVTQRSNVSVIHEGKEHLAMTAWTIGEGDSEGFAEWVVRIEGRVVARFVIEFYR